MDMFGENFRGVHALNLLTGSRGWTLERLNAAAYDSHQPGFAVLIPMLVKAYDDLPKGDFRRERLGAPIAVLRTWNYRWSGESVAQSLAMFWGDELMKRLNAPDEEPSNIKTMRVGTDTTPGQKLDALDRRGRSAAARLRPLAGAVGRDQPLPAHLAGDRPAVQRRRAEHRRAVRLGPLGLARIVQLEAPGRARRDGTRTPAIRFVAVVEFGPRVRARAVRAGGQSGDPASPHFNDQALRYASGALRDVYFYPGAAQGPHRAGVPAGRVDLPKAPRTCPSRGPGRRGPPAR